MAAISGKLGTLTIAGSGTINFRSWTINDAGPAAIDVTAFADTWHARTVGINDWSFTAEGVLDAAVNILIPTAAAACVFGVETTRQFTGDAIVRFSPSATIDGEATVSISGDGAGVLTIV